jgi:hypothetical protein
VVVSGDIVYAAGKFDNIGGAARNYIAALEAATGKATVWDPSADRAVVALAVSGNTVYAGGGFENIGGQPRNHIAALDSATGQATAWDPDSNGSVHALALNGDTMYVGGSFSSIGEAARNSIAALDLSTGLATGWDPDADEVVLALAVNGNRVYAGGEFWVIDDQTRYNIAALNATGKATDWDPNVSGIVHTLVVHGEAVYAGGEFRLVGEQCAHNLAGILKEVPGTIVIKKKTKPGGGTGFVFSQDIDSTGDLSLDDRGSRTFQDVAPGHYAVTENNPTETPGDFDLTALRCKDSDEGGTASTGDKTTRTATINLDPAETVTCTFINTERGRIIVEKGTEPGGDPTAFKFSGDLKASLKDGERDGKTVMPGTYAVQEAVPAGWVLQGISCSDGDSSGNVDSATATYRVKAGEAVLCTFTNAKKGNITVKMRTVPSGSDEVCTFTGAIEAQLKDGESATVAVAPGSHSVWELPVQGWTLTSIECDDTDSTTDVGQGVATYRVKPGEDVTCTFTNERAAPDYEIYLPLVLRSLE